MPPSTPNLHQASYDAIAGKFRFNLPILTKKRHFNMPFFTKNSVFNVPILITNINNQLILLKLILISIQKDINMIYQGIRILK